MTDFKVGDRVRDYSPGPFKGQVGTVVEVYGGYLGIRFDNYHDYYADEDDRHARKAEQLELVEEAPEFERGDRVTWSKYPEYGTGTVLFSPGAETHLSVVFDEFDYEGFDDTVSGYHTPKSEDLEFADATEEVLGDDVNHPAHYNQGKIEVWDFIYDQGLGYAIGNAIKYEVRAGKKAGNSKVKDLRKAIAFLEREIRFEETGE